MVFRSLYISFIFVILLSASIDALRHRSVRHKRADLCLNPSGNACLFVVCENGGQCIEDSTTIDCFRCQCTVGYTGKVCDTSIVITPGVCNPVCQNGGFCNVNVCVCPSGYTGTFCEIRDFCSPTNPCQNGGRCTSTGVNYQCDCTGTGYTGTVCTDVTPTDPCTTNPCNGGQCTWDGVTTNCVCFNGYTGAFCQIPPVPCASTPCQNGGQCELLATNAYGCVCPAEFTGSQCETSILVNHPCVTMPEIVCLNGGLCTVNGVNYLCKCATGWTGANCETQAISNSCSPSPCSVHGSCVEAVVPGGTTIAYCNCENQWTGKICDVNMAAGCSVGYCVTGTCQIVGNAPYCTCPPLYTGQRCDTLIGAVTTTSPPVVISCSPNPCQNAGTCYPFNNGYVCACLPTWTGPTCGIPATVTISPGVSPCASNPCLYGGTCYRNGNAFLCACQSGWAGARCEYSQGVTVTMPLTTPSGGITCAYQPCRNGGTCYNLSNNAYACVCPSVYTGTNCESIVTTYCPLDCAPGYCVPSGGSMAPYVCNCNGILKLTNCVSK